MTGNRLNQAPQIHGNVVGIFTFDQLRNWCDERNAKAYAIETSVWYFVVRATPDRPAHVVELSGWQAKEARAKYQQRHTIEWFVPKAGEAAWIHRAVAEYRKRFPQSDALGEGRDHFNATMAKWSYSKPWTRGGAVG